MRNQEAGPKQGKTPCPWRPRPESKTAWPSRWKLSQFQEQMEAVPRTSRHQLTGRRKAGPGRLGLCSATQDIRESVTPRSYPTVMGIDSTSEQSPSVWFCNRYCSGKREGLGRKGKRRLDSQGPRVGRDSTPPLHNPRTACDVHLPERNKMTSPPHLTQSDSHKSTQ